MDSCAGKRLTWLRAMHEKGSRVKVGNVDGERVGFLHVIPIKSCPWGPLGRDLLVIPCLVPVNKGRGVGKALLDGAEEEAMHQGRKGIVTTGYYHDHWFMPARFFEANGLLRCPSAGKSHFDLEHKAAVLWKVFDEHGEAPVLLRPRYEFRPVPEKVVIDLFWNAFCQTSDIEAQRVREVAAEFRDSVVLNEYLADDRPALLRHQMARGILVDGHQVYWGYEAPKDGIRDAITKALGE